MRQALVVIGALLFATAAFAQADTAPVAGKDVHRVTPTETHVKGDLNSLESRMTVLTDRRDALDAKIEELQKKIDAAQGTVDKLSK